MFLVRAVERSGNKQAKQASRGAILDESTKPEKRDERMKPKQKDERTKELHRQRKMQASFRSILGCIHLNNSDWAHG